MTSALFTPVCVTTLSDLPALLVLWFCGSTCSRSPCFIVGGLAIIEALFASPISASEKLFYLVGCGVEGASNGRRLFLPQTSDVPLYSRNATEWTVGSLQPTYHVTIIFI